MCALNHYNLKVFTISFFFKMFPIENIPFKLGNTQCVTPLSPLAMLSDIRLNKLHASAMAAKSLISYTCLITVVGSHFLFDMQPSRVKQTRASSERGPNSHLI